MKTMKRYLFIVSFIFFIVGILLLSCGVAFGGSPSFTISNSGVHIGSKMLKQFTKEKEKIEDITKLSIKSHNNIEFIPDNDFYISYDIYAEREPNISIKNNKMTYREEETAEINFFSFQSNERKEGIISIYYPEDTNWEEVILQTYDSDIQIPVMQTNKIQIEDSYGDIMLEQIIAQIIEVKSYTGTVDCNTIYSNKFYVKNSYGSVNFKDIEVEEGSCDLYTSDVSVDNFVCSNFELDNSYGDIILEQVTAQIIKIKSYTGIVDCNTIYSDEFYVENKYGPVIFKNIEGKKGICNTYTSDVSADNFVCSDLELKMNYGTLTGSQFSVNKLNADFYTIDCDITEYKGIDSTIKLKYGSIDLVLEEEIESYSYDLICKDGTINIDGETIEEDYKVQGTSPDYQLNIDSYAGDIAITKGKK